MPMDVRPLLGIPYYNPLPLLPLLPFKTSTALLKVPELLIFQSLVVPLPTPTFGTMGPLLKTLTIYLQVPIPLPLPMPTTVRLPTPLCSRNPLSLPRSPCNLLPLPVLVVAMVALI